ncbi:hypothetical protein BDW02DRAFT_325935 [Decorospora gaudefroyi]|uniref:ThrRS/AlaRS common domain-containing protein n=1 Tax=Decorospora gaudefroyi TaxID=184978 RepID=A0A6A5K9R6_9PLEO|nr:hypothetical protein BDW02DRAFT_325935 [Decorospora gaudefroyi]
MRPLFTRTSIHLRGLVTHRKPSTPRTATEKHPRSNPVHYSERIHTRMANPLSIRTEPLYQKDGQKYTHTSTLTSIQPLSSLPHDTQALFKPPPETTPYILTTPSTIFHAQGGGQPSDTGTIASPTGGATFHVHQVRKVDPTILHMGVFSPPDTPFADHQDGKQPIDQKVDIQKRILHSRIHTAGHVIGLAINQLIQDGTLPPTILDSKASHYPGASFVEFCGLIPGSAKPLIQAHVDAMVAQDLPVQIEFWSAEKARSECTGGGVGLVQDGGGDGVTGGI